tara:strand:+ start:7158 stop:7625 length:468 start_codon:yes stop_codon:yes gene_type:complete
LVVNTGQTADATTKAKETLLTGFVLDNSCIGTDTVELTWNVDADPLVRVQTNTVFGLDTVWVLLVTDAFVRITREEAGGCSEEVHTGLCATIGGNTATTVSVRAALCEVEWFGELRWVFTGLCSVPDVEVFGGCDVFFDLLIGILTFCGKGRRND